MGSFFFFLALSICILAFVLGGGWFKRRRREKIRLQAFPGAYKTILKRCLPVYSCLPDKFKRELEESILVFLSEKYFEGCGGIILCDEIRVSIAGQARLLLLNRQTDIYPQLRTILVYPSAYIARGERHIDGQIAEEESVRLGESWTRGTVILAWDNVETGAKDFHDGQNVVFHEFAHQLDQEDGIADGTPALRGGEDRYFSWAEVCQKEFEDLQQRAIEGKQSLLDTYGATDPAEFFAVATETFFERPVEFGKQHPELFGQFKDYYQVDPREWQALQVVDRCDNNLVKQ